MDDLGQGLEFALLTAPFGAGAPAGSDPRQDFSPQSVYFRLRDARSEARAIERRLDHHDPGYDGNPAPHWRQVRDLSVKLLTEQTKDLEIAAWLTEALVREKGVGGVAIGARLIADLVETFWEDGLHPLPDEDGIATRVAPITGLNGEGGEGTLMQPLRKQELFARSDGPPVTFWQYTQSEELETIVDPARRKQRLGANVELLDGLVRGAQAAGGAHFAALRADTVAALDAWGQMTTRLDARAGRDAPPTGRVRDLLGAILDVVNRYAPPEPEATSSDSAGDAAEDGHMGADGSVATVSSGGRRTPSREDVLRDLGRIAEYFRRTEPHSPLAYTLDEAVRRGRMTLPELLGEVVPDDAVRSSILVMLGIRPNPPTT